MEKAIPNGKTKVMFLCHARERDQNLGLQAHGCCKMYEGI